MEYPSLCFIVYDWSISHKKGTLAPAISNSADPDSGISSGSSLVAYVPGIMFSILSFNHMALRMVSTLCIR